MNFRLFPFLILIGGFFSTYTFFTYDYLASIEVPIVLTIARIDNTFVNGEDFIIVDHIQENSNHIIQEFPSDTYEGKEGAVVFHVSGNYQPSDIKHAAVLSGNTTIENTEVLVNFTVYYVDSKTKEKIEICQFDQSHFCSIKGGEIEGDLFLNCILPEPQP